MIRTEEELFQSLRLRTEPTAGRQFIALAGPPAAGKSTLAVDLCQRFNDLRPNFAAVLSQDGFHFDDAVLKERGLWERKGASHTFDVAGLKALLERLNHADESEIAIPVFDRKLEISRNAAAIIASEVQVIIVEGNYLLLDESPWASLRDCFQTAVFLQADRIVLRSRLQQRWSHLPTSEANHKIEANDLANAEHVLHCRQKADLTVDLSDPL